MEGDKIKIEDRKLKCEICEKTFKFGKRNLNEHIKSAHFIKVEMETLRYVCQICGKSYLQLENFRKHEKKHKSLKDANYDCSICSKSFKKNPQTS